jgi:hypothetical protein
VDGGVGITGQERKKRGLFNAIGLVGKELFGLQTEQDAKELKQAIENNQKGLAVISHQSNKMLSIVNVTRMQMIENRKAINSIIDKTTQLRDWLRSKAGTFLYQTLVFKIQALEISVQDLERENQKMLRMRKDLERGLLSEDLLPLEELRSLINSPVIPKGNTFVSPLYWYYSKLNVNLIQMGKELIYSVDLPLVSEEHSLAKQFKSYPTPNLHRNVTIQVSVHDSTYFKSHTGQVIELPKECVGEHPLVCPPMAVRRNFVDNTCMASLLNLTSKGVSQQCPVRISRSTEERLYYHDVNSFVLVTWGTEVTEGCYHTTVLSLKAGVYLIEWSGKCSLCTRHHCIKGILRTGSSIRLRNAWQALKIPNVGNFSSLAIMEFPEKLSIPKAITLHDLVTDDSPIIQWSSNKTSVTIDVMIVFLIACVCGAVGVKYYRTRRTCREEIAASEIELESVKPLNKSDQTDNLEQESNKTFTPMQAASFLTTLTK